MARRSANNAAGGSVLLDSLLYDEQELPAKLWLDDETLLVRVKDSGFDAITRSVWARIAPAHAVPVTP